MSARKHRTRVVLDTNVWVRNFKARGSTNANRRVVRLWLLEKRLQLVVSPEIVREYLEVFGEVLGMERDLVDEWRGRFESDRRATLVNLGPRVEESRDPDDNVFLATAFTGQAKFLLTNDRDLLDLPESVQVRLPFAILTPRDFLASLEDR